MLTVYGNEQRTRHFSFAKRKEKSMEHKLRLRLIRNPQTKQERKTSKLQNERAEMPAGYAKKQRKGCKAFRERSQDIRKRRRLAPRSCHRHGPRLPCCCPFLSYLSKRKLELFRSSCTAEVISFLSNQSSIDNGHAVGRRVNRHILLYQGESQMCLAHHTS